MTAQPLHLSQTKGDVDLGPLVLGAKAMGFTPNEQQEVIARVILSDTDGIPTHRRVGVSVPRRAGKTTAIWAVCIGLCLAVPGFRVLVTAQSGVKVRERFTDVLETLEPGPYEARRAMGGERLIFDNGSRLLVLPPKPASFRGEAADLVFIDEGQEHDPETAKDLLGAILPLMDTRPKARLVVAGTPGKFRAGLLWDALERGRQGKGGIVEYAAPEGADLEDEQVWLETHPGIGTLTTLDIVRERREDLGPVVFSYEYLGQWPVDSSTRAIPAEIWERLGHQVFSDRPDRFAIGVDVAPDGSSAAISAAWRDADGLGHIQVIDHRPQSGWVSKALYDLYKRYPGVHIGWDGIGANLEATEALLKVRPKVTRYESLGFSEIKVASARLWQDIHESRLRHYRQPPLDDAAAIATRRQVGDSWTWGRKASGGDITPLVSACVALYIADHIKPKASVSIRV